MSKTHKSIRLEPETVDHIEALAFKEDRTFSAMTEKLLREGIDARSIQKPNEVTHD